MKTTQEKNDLQDNIINRRAYYQAGIDAARDVGSELAEEYWQDRLDLYMSGLADGYAMCLQNIAKDTEKCE